jgi:hypothetical protein
VFTGSSDIPAEAADRAAARSEERQQGGPDEDHDNVFLSGFHVQDASHGLALVPWGETLLFHATPAVVQPVRQIADRSHMHLIND